MSRASSTSDDRSKKEIRRDMACEDPDDNPAILVYRAIYERDYDERPWEDAS